MTHELPKGITRVDKERKTSIQHGYLARYVLNGKMYRKWFGDPTYGGKRESLHAASTWLEEIKMKLHTGG